MIAIGCLLLIVLPLAGFVAGGWLAGINGAKWGAVAGFCVAAAMCSVASYALVKASARR